MDRIQALLNEFEPPLFDDIKDQADFYRREYHKIRNFLIQIQEDIRNGGTVSSTHQVKVGVSVNPLNPVMPSISVQYGYTRTTIKPLSSSTDPQSSHLNMPDINVELDGFANYSLKDLVKKVIKCPSVLNVLARKKKQAKELQEANASTSADPIDAVTETEEFVVSMDEIEGVEEIPDAQIKELSDGATQTEITNFNDVTTQTQIKKFNDATTQTVLTAAMICLMDKNDVSGNAVQSLVEEVVEVELREILEEMIKDNAEEQIPSTSGHGGPPPIKKVKSPGNTSLLRNVFGKNTYWGSLSPFSGGRKHVKKADDDESKIGPEKAEPTKTAVKTIHDSITETDDCDCNLKCSCLPSFRQCAVM